MISELSDTEIVRRGLMAARILDDAEIQAFLEEQAMDIMLTAFDTDPAQTKDREKLFFEHKGIKEFIERLKLYRSSASRILDAIELISEDADEEETED